MTLVVHPVCARVSDECMHVCMYAWRVCVCFVCRLVCSGYVLNAVEFPAAQFDSIDLLDCAVWALHLYCHQLHLALHDLPLASLVSFFSFPSHFFRRAACRW